MYELHFVHSPSNPQHPSCLVMFRYVKLYVLPDKNSKMKTAVKKNTTHPVYNEVLKVKKKKRKFIICAFEQFSVKCLSKSCVLQYQINRHLLFGKRLQASVWHSRTLKRKTFLGEVLIPLDGWRFEDKASQRCNWYPLCPRVRHRKEEWQTFPRLKRAIFNLLFFNMCVM